MFFNSILTGSLFVMASIIHAQTEIFIPAAKAPQSGVYKFKVSENGTYEDVEFLERSRLGLARLTSDISLYESGEFNAFIAIFELSEYINILSEEQPLAGFLFRGGSSSLDYIMDIKLLSIIDKGSDPIEAILSPNINIILGTAQPSDGAGYWIRPSVEWKSTDAYAILGFFPNDISSNGFVDIAIESCAMRIRSSDFLIKEKFEIHTYIFNDQISGFPEVKCQVFGVWKGEGTAGGKIYNIETSNDLITWAPGRQLYSGGTLTNFSSNGITLGSPRFTSQRFLRVNEVLE